MLFESLFLCVKILFAQDKSSYFHIELDMIIPNNKKVVC